MPEPDNDRPIGKALEANLVNERAFLIPDLPYMTSTSLNKKSMEEEDQDFHR